MANRVSLDRCVNSVVQLVCSAQEGFGIKPEMFFAEAIKRTVTNERAFYHMPVRIVEIVLNYQCYSQPYVSFLSVRVYL